MALLCTCVLPRGNLQLMHNPSNLCFGNMSGAIQFEVCVELSFCLLAGGPGMVYSNCIETVTCLVFNM